jgi:hypothetical protein
MATKQWTGPSGAAWETDGDWQTGGTPTTADTAVLGTADSGLVAGDGVAGSLVVSGTYTLDGTIDITGAASVSGVLAVLGVPQPYGSTIIASATLSTDGALIGGTGAAVEVTLADWDDAGTVTIAAGGQLSLRDDGVFSGNAVTVSAGGQLDIGPASVFTAAALTAGGLVVSLGSLSAGTLTLNPGADMIAQGTLAASVTVAQGALLDGAPVIAGAVANDGTIEGAVAASPLEITGPVGGAGTLLIDLGGGLQLDGPVAAGQTVVFAPGASPIYVDSDGAAGGVLVLNDVQDFAGTIDGLALGDRLYVAPVGTDAVASAVIVGSDLELQDSGGTILATLTLADTTLSSGTTFVVGPPAVADLFDPPSVATTGAVEITALAPGGGPSISASGPVVTAAGLATVVPPISGADPLGYAAGDTFTMTLQASSGSLTELLSLPLFFNALVSFVGEGSGNPFDPRPVGDGSIDEPSLTGSGPDETLSVSGTGTDTLTISSNNLFLLDLQTAFVLYQAGGAGTITATFSNGTTSVATSVPIVVQSAPVSFAWVTGGGNNSENPANWSGAGGVAGPPGAGDPISFGAGSYAITGDIAGASVTVTGNVLTQGALYFSGAASGPTVLVQGGGIFGSAGFIYAQGDAVVGGAGAGELDLSGVINNFTGNLIVGGQSSGYARVGGLVAVNQSVIVGLGAYGQLDVTAAQITSGGALAIGGALISAGGTIGAGALGVAEVDGGNWSVTGTLYVGDASQGVLTLGYNGGYHGSVAAGALEIGAQAGVAGTVYDNGVLSIGSLVSFGAGGGTLDVEGEDLTVGTYDADDDLLGGVIAVGGAGAVAGDTLIGDGYIAATTLDVGAHGVFQGGGFFVNELSVTAGGLLDINEGPASEPSTTNDFAVLGVSATIDNAGLQVADTTTIGAGSSLLVDNGNLISDGLSVAAGAEVTFIGTAGVEGLPTAGQFGPFYDSGTGGSVDIAGTLQLDGVVVTVAVNTTIEPQGILIGNGELDANAIVNSGTIEAAGGNLTLSGTVSGNGGVIIGNGATLSLLPNALVPSPILFESAATLLVTDETTSYDPSAPAVQSYSSPLQGFGGSDAIHVVTGFFAGYETIESYSNNVLSVLDQAENYDADSMLAADEATLLQFTIPGAVSAADFTLTALDGYDFLITSDLPCFRAGTALATPTGACLVERLAVGDALLTASGGVRTVRWIGHRHVDFARHPAPQRVLPVRITPGAFGPGRPHRPLYLSPDHAVFFDGVLIPVKHLINGTSVRQVRMRSTTYYHVELPLHDVVLAEGLPTESYLDTGDRAGFANGGTVVTLHPTWGEARRDAARRFDAFGAAPLRVTGPEVARARALLSGKARRGREATAVPRRR